MKIGTFMVAMLAICASLAREFQNAFSCQAGDPMVSANACIVW
jgi:hypothetical protein